jgi:hypothetical protein
MTNSGPMDELACYRPVIGGVAHLTWQRRNPPVRSLVRTLCGVTYSVPAEAKPRTGECSACDDAFRDYFDLPRRHEPSAADPSHPSATDPEHGGPPQQPTGAGRAPTAPAPVGHHVECAS